MSKQTAVEWLLQKIEEKNGTEFSSYYTEFVEQAKAMEKRQIKDAYIQGDEDGFHSTESQADYEIEGRSDYVANEYYQSVFGQNQNK